MVLNQAWLCVDGVGMPCYMWNTGMLQKYVGCQHLSVTDFTVGGKRCLNIATVLSLYAKYCNVRNIDLLIAALDKPECAD